MRKIWNMFVKLLNKVGVDKWYHVLMGLLIAILFGDALHMGVWCFVPVVFAAFIKEFFDMWTGEKADWWDFGATCFGGLYVTIMQIIGICW